MDGFLRLSAKSKPSLLSADFLSAAGQYLRFRAGAALGSLQRAVRGGDVKAACAGGTAFLSADCWKTMPHTRCYRRIKGMTERWIKKLL